MARDNPAGSAPSLVEYAHRLCTDRLTAYTAAPHDAEEHANIEESVLAGGYAYRQVAELIQNAADAVAELVDPNGNNRIQIVADRYGLWAANTGAPVDEAGVRALLNAHSSNKRANQIGRFGLGFKSLLRLGGKIHVLSRSVCLHFDPAATRQQIRSHLGLAADAPAPGLRIADADDWASGLASVEGADRYDWATTIVFAAVQPGPAQLAIFQEIRNFPEEFLLFLPCDLDLVMAFGDTIRSLRRRTEPDGCVIIEDLVDKESIPQRWRLFETTAAIRDPAAIDDATTVHYRETVPIIWAAPVGAPQQSRMFKETRTGKFFAFFPTSTDSRTLGILNAPWKLNNDRTALVSGAWNDALMEEAAKLVAGSVAELGTVDDPGAVLDGFPRELQSASDPASPLVRALWELLADAPVIPNCDGEYFQASGLLRHPADSSAIASEWSALAPPEACETHVHPTCLSTPARTSRLNALATRIRDRAEGKPALGKTPAFEWLEMTATTDADAAKDVIRLVDSYARQEKGVWWDANRAKLPVILTADGTVDAAGNLVLGDHPEPPLRAVHPRLAADTEVRKILQETFYVRDKSEVKVIDHVDARIDAAQRSGDWEPVWTLLRSLPFEEASRIVTRRPIRIRTLGGWGTRGRVYRKGELVTDRLIESIPQDQIPAALAMLVDESWHARDHALLDEMGIEPNPEPLWVEYRWPASPESPAEQWMEDWRQKWLERYYVHLHCRPSRDQLSPGSFEMPLGWEWLLLAEGEERLAISHWIMESIEQADDEEFGPVEFRHANRFAYEAAEYPHPVWCLLLERGALGQADVSIPFSALLTVGMLDRAEMVPSIASWQASLEKLDTAAAENNSPSSTKDTWSEWLEYASREQCAPGELARLYEGAAKAGFAPASLPSLNGPVPLSTVCVASTERDAAMAAQAGLIAVHLSPAASACWFAAGARSLNDSRELGWDAALGEDLVSYVEIEPALSELLQPGKSTDAWITLVSSLTQRLGQQSVATPWLLSDGSIYVDRASFEPLGWSEKILLLVEAGEAAGWMRPDYDVTQILQSGPVAKRHAVAAEPDLPSRLLKATGGLDSIMKLFEPDVRRSNLVNDPHRAASVALTLFGPSLLAIKEIRDAMAHQGLDPPPSWTGTRTAEFVAAIGFPPEYAVAPQRKLEPELLVQGPIPYRELHDFQNDVIGKLDGLIAEKESRRRRAVISLPTGAGKTRVAAECCVTRILKGGTGKRLVLWIAQSEELCEQAVQCFRELWSNLGLQDEPLRIVRFWGGQGNPKQSAHGVPTVVVATIQTLQSRMTNGDVSWISSPDFVVIDECHHALTPTYTGTFSWLNADRNEGREPPIVGLSATPFRGSSEEETRALARRFDGRLYPQQQANLFEQLQERGVLARFTYDRLEIEERLELSEDEQRSLEKFNKLPVAAMERLGLMHGRNARIVSEIRQAGEKSALVFATSVKHARRLAARLNLLGVKAAAVTGETDKNSRRWFIEAFRKGDIRVLCNHSALTTGFDAPATDLIVVARPVFSPSLYMQMVGRGLRGPVNGGKEQCRILTVQDNLDQYTGKLAHHFFERYYVNA